MCQSQRRLQRFLNDVGGWRRRRRLARSAGLTHAHAVVVEVLRTKQMLRRRRNGQMTRRGAGKTWERIRPIEPFSRTHGVLLGLVDEQVGDLQQSGLYLSMNRPATARGVSPAWLLRGRF